MSLISMMEARLPPGFRFHPRDDELVLDYLCRKLSGKGGGGVGYGGIAMVDVDLNKCEPWELPGEACVGGREWYFFSLHDRKYATGQRTNRATRSGYWKATGKDRLITRRRGSGAGAAGVVVGTRKTLVFYQGRAPRGTKTEWVMHEFRAAAAAAAAAPVAVAGRPGSPLIKEDWVLCRVFYKSRTTTAARPPAADEEAASLSGELISLPTQLPDIPPVDAYLAFNHAPAAAITHYYQQQDSGLPAAHHRPALPLKSLSSFRDLLSSMVEGGGGAMAAAEFHQEWTEAAYAQQQIGVSSQTWNPF
ncbi:hypothetical protein ACP70R_010315 [Stipagrostis hirtigluma subsp. patula]